MKKLTLTLSWILMIHLCSAENIEKTYYFRNYSIQPIGAYQTIAFDHTRLAALPGEPLLPYQEIALILPPGETAISVEVTGFDETGIPGSFLLYPQQPDRPFSEGPGGSFLKKESVYQRDGNYPAKRTGELVTSFLNGYSIALCSFTPMVYNPARQTVSFFREVTIRIVTRPDERAAAALRNVTPAGYAIKNLRALVQNPEIMERYPKIETVSSDYQMLIITPAEFSGAFEDLIDFHNPDGLIVQLVTIEYIDSHSLTGLDLPEKIRNYIIQEYQTNHIEHVLLGGDAELVPYRGLYGRVQSSVIYTDTMIPGDIYYAALDGTWNNDALPGGNPNYWGEPGEEDLLPEISVSRMPFSTEQEQVNMIHKTISYLASPVVNDLNRPLMLGEFLWLSPLTFGGDNMDLLINDHQEYGYFTHGIPENTNVITKLYDSITPENTLWAWTVVQLLEEINAGKSFIHHDGHCNIGSMMHLTTSMVTDETFSLVNGIDHNFLMIYSNGCLCGAFDANDCIGEKSMTIANYLAGGVLNSRYGFFNEGQTEGPSLHLHREFVSAVYQDTLPTKELGMAHTLSKIKSAPWVTAPNQHEPGAQRWCHYCCNAFGDPALRIWTQPPPNSIPDLLLDQEVSVYPNPAIDQVEITIDLPVEGAFSIQLINQMGQPVWQTGYTGAAPGLQKYTISVQDLPTGMYYLMLKDGFQQVIRKLVVYR